MAWVIDGNTFTGDVVTLGNGKQYTTIASVITRMISTKKDTLVLVYGGTYGNIQLSHVNLANVSLYIKGMENHADVEFKDASTVFQIGVPVNLFIEGCKLSCSNTYQGATSSAGVNNFSITINRCIVNMPNASSYGAFYLRKTSGYELVLPFRLMYSDCNFPVFIGGTQNYPLYNKAHVTVDKCVVKSLSCRYMTGTFAVQDVVYSPSDGYGDSYGAYLITEENYGYLKNRRSRFDTFGRVLDVMEPCIRYLPFRGRDRFFRMLQ